VTLQDYSYEIIKIESIKSSRWKYKDSSILLFQNMLAQNQAQELPLKHFFLALIEDLAADSSFFPCGFVHLGPGGQSFPDNHRLQKSNLEERRTTKGSFTATIAE